MLCVSCLVNRYVSYVFHIFQASLATRAYSSTVARAVAVYLPQRWYRRTLRTKALCADYRRVV